MIPWLFSFLTGVQEDTTIPAFFCAQNSHSEFCMYAFLLSKGVLKIILYFRFNTDVSEPKNDK